MLPSNFWQEEEDRFYNNTARVMLAIFLAGTENGAMLLPREFRVNINWDVVNQAALTFLRQYRLTTVKNISDVTRNNLIEIINEWIRSGEPLDLLVARMQPWVGNRRAQRIAVTEVTRTYASGNMASWASTGLVGGKRWNTAEDEKVCPYCGPMDQRIVGLGENFANDVVLPTGRVVHSDAIAPPLHPNCRCWLTPVVSNELLRERIRQELAR